MSVYVLEFFGCASSLQTLTLFPIHAELGCYRVVWPEDASAVSVLFLPPGPIPNEREWGGVRRPRAIHVCNCVRCLHTPVETIRPGVGIALA